MTATRAATAKPLQSFDPQPSEDIVLFGEKLVFQPAPNTAFPMVDSSEGRRALIYRVRGAKGADQALKVFRQQFQDPSLKESCEHLEPLRALEGLRAADRRVVLPTEPAVQRFSQLRYAMLMPWIAGKTWRDILGLAQQGQQLEPSWAIHLCARLLTVLGGLEEIGAAHTDVAPGNIVMVPDTLDVQLIDLEDLYLPGRPRGPFDNMGISGYCHPSNPSLACSEGDRYATAILSAEILLLAHPGLAAKTDERGFFGDNHRSQEAVNRFQQAEDWLRQFAPVFLELLRRAWSSSSLADCPRIVELRAAVEVLARAIPREAPPALVARGTLPPAWIVWDSSASASAAKDWLQWEGEMGAPASQTSSTSPLQPAAQAKDWITWASQTVTAPPPPPTSPAAPQRSPAPTPVPSPPPQVSSRSGFWIAVFVILASLLLFFYLLHR